METFLQFKKRENTHGGVLHLVNLQGVLVLVLNSKNILMHFAYSNHAVL